MHFDSRDVVRRVAALREVDSGLRVFGSSGHHYELATPLDETSVAEAERQWGVEFPEDYRTFLREVGSGGAGPYYGLFRLSKVRGRWRWVGDGGDLTSDLRAPFPHRSAWNAEHHPMRAELPDAEDDSDEAHAMRDRFDDEVYWHPSQTVGAICLCHEGCALRDWLVVTGEERGHVWYDGRADEEGLKPRTKGGRRVTFARWYLDWLAAAEREVERKR